MYLVTRTITRPNTSVPFLEEQEDATASLNRHQLIVQLFAAPGFVKQVKYMSNDKLTRITNTWWQTEALHAAFLQDPKNKSIIDAIQLASEAHNTATGIIETLKISRISYKAYKAGETAKNAAMSVEMAKEKAKKQPNTPPPSQG